MPEGRLWFALEKKPSALALFPKARVEPDLPLPPALAASAPVDAEEAVVETIRGHLDIAGPCTLTSLCAATALREIHVEQALAKLELEGFVLRGHFDSSVDAGVEQLCARRLLARIHAYTQDRLRREIEPVTAQDFMRFLLRWQHVAPNTKREGRRGVLSVVEQLQGFEIQAGAWEETVLPSRVQGYRSEWLDDLCHSGEVVWGRLTLRPASDALGRGGATPSRATPLSLAVRDDLPWLLAAARGDGTPGSPGAGAARDLLDCMAERGALFQSELAALTSRLPVEIEEGLWDLVSRGLVSADGFDALRSLLGARVRWGRRRERKDSRRRLRRGARGGTGADGRWVLLPQADPWSNRRGGTRRYLHNQGGHRCWNSTSFGYPGLRCGPGTILRTDRAIRPDYHRRRD